MKKLVLLSLLFATAAGAQQYSIDWHKIAGGGGASAGGNYQVNGTIGQPDASGVMNGGNYSMTSGFWSLVSVVQTAGMPQLYISSSGNVVTVYWQDVPGYALQQNSDAASPGWTPCGYAVNTSNGTNSITITSPSGNMFFRLTKP